jgi:hypothetical protein
VVRGLLVVGVGISVAPPELLKVSALALGGTTGPAITPGSQRNLFSRRWRWSQIGVAGRSDRRTGPLHKNRADRDDAIEPRNAVPDLVANVNRLSGLCALTVDPNMPGSALRRSQRSGLDQPNRPDPAIDSSGCRGLSHELGGGELGVSVRCVGFYRFG